MKIKFKTISVGSDTQRRRTGKNETLNTTSNIRTQPDKTSVCLFVGRIAQASLSAKKQCFIQTYFLLIDSISMSIKPMCMSAACFLQLATYGNPIVRISSKRQSKQSDSRYPLLVLTQVETSGIFRWWLCCGGTCINICLGFTPTRRFAVAII